MKDALKILAWVVGTLVLLPLAAMFLGWYIHILLELAFK